MEKLGAFSSLLKRENERLTQAGSMKREHERAADSGIWPLADPDSHRQELHPSRRNLHVT